MAAKLIRNRCRGTAMIEFVLSLPLLLLILMLVFFFGRGMVRAQHSIAMVHYELWRAHMPARHVVTGDTWPVAPAADAPNHLALNQTFHGGRSATRLQLRSDGSFPYLAGEHLVRTAENRDVAEIMARIHLGRNDAGRTLSSSVTRPEQVPLWQQFDPEIRHTQTAFGHPFSYVYGFRVTEIAPAMVRWSYDPARRRDPNVMHSVRDVYFVELDQRLADITGADDQANPLAQRVRDLYRAQPAYRGPGVPAP
jgi:hypothetical protein